MITSLIIMSLFCNGWYLITRPNMILFYIHKKYVQAIGGDFTGDGFEIWYENKPFWKWLYKPLFGCVTCMASIWGSIAYWSIYSWNLGSLQFYPVAIIATSALNLIINRIYDK